MFQWTNGVHASVNCLMALYIRLSLINRILLHSPWLQWSSCRRENQCVPSAVNGVQNWENFRPILSLWQTLLERCFKFILVVFVHTLSHDFCTNLYLFNMLELEQAVKVWTGHVSSFWCVTYSKSSENEMQSYDF